MGTKKCFLFLFEKMCLLISIKTGWVMLNVDMTNKLGKGSSFHEDKYPLTTSSLCGFFPWDAWPQDLVILVYSSDFTIVCPYGAIKTAAAALHLLNFFLFKIIINLRTKRLIFFLICYLSQKLAYYACSKYTTNIYGNNACQIQTFGILENN